MASIVASLVIHVGLVSSAARIGLPVAEFPVDVIPAELTAPEPAASPVRKPEPPARRVVRPQPELVPSPETPPKLIDPSPPKVEEPRVVETPAPPLPLVVAAPPVENPSPAVAASTPAVPLPQSSIPNARQSSSLSGVSIVTSEPAAPGRATSTPTPGPTASLAPDALTGTAIPRGGYQVRPSYPSSARRLGVEGTTMLRVHVDAEGRVGDILVEASAGHSDLDQAAVDAVRRWRFDPARRGNDPVAMWVRLPVEFRLR